MTRNFYEITFEDKKGYERFDGFGNNPAYLWVGTKTDLDKHMAEQEKRWGIKVKEIKELALQ